MKTSLDHLPSLKRAELLRVVEVLKASFAEAMSTKRAERLKNGRILKIILYGSYARGDWVHDPVGRYFSDFDILIVVDHEDLTDSEIWDAALWRTTPGVSRLRTPISFIVHSLDDVNQKLELGRYFFTDIIRDGVVLFNEPGASFVKPQPLTPSTALSETEEYFEEWDESAAELLETAAFTRSRGFSKKTAFLLHQAAEALYIGLLLVLTLYTPRSHNLVHLRKMTEPLVPRLAEVWPHETKFQKRCFELLRGAYVKSRYSRHYKITDEELAYVTERIALLREIVREACESRLEALRRNTERAGD